MEVSRALEFQNSPLTSSLIKHFSPIDREGATPLNKCNVKYYQQNTTRQMSKRATRCNLPKSATNILKEWLLKNWHNPYPTDDEKNLLTKETKLKSEQVNNWLINARRRLLPSICLKYGLDHSKCRIAKRGGNKGFVLDKSKLIDHQPSELEVPSSNVMYNIVLRIPDSPEHPTMLDYLADVMLVNEELEKSPNSEGLSRMELLCRRGLGERMHPCSP